MKIRFLFLALLLLTGIGLTYTAVAAVDQTEAIILQHASPTSVMSSLHLIRAEDVVDGKPALFTPKAGQNEVVLPQKIYLAAADEAHRAIVVYGDRDAVAALKTKVMALDVAPKQVQVKVEVFSMNAGRAADLGLPTTPDRQNGLADISKSVIDKLRAGGDSTIVSVAAPTVNAVDGLPSSIAVSSMGSGAGAGMQVLASTKEDNKIGLYINFSLTTPGKSGPRTEMLTTSRLLDNGESSLIGAFAVPSGETMAIVATAKIVE